MAAKLSNRRLVNLLSASLSLFLLCFLRCPEAKAASGHFGKFEQAKPALDCGNGAKLFAKKSAPHTNPFVVFLSPQETQFRNQFSYFPATVTLPSLSRFFVIRSGLSPPVFS